MNRSQMQLLRLIIVILVAMFISTSMRPPRTLLAQTRSALTGRVVDSAGASVGGARVDVVGSYAETLTRVDGSFLVDEVIRGSVLRVRKVGYRAVVVSVDTIGTPIIIRLIENPLRLQPVAVIAERPFPLARILQPIVYARFQLSLRLTFLDPRCCFQVSLSQTISEAEYIWQPGQAMKHW
jgi:hypothetical protein